MIRDFPPVYQKLHRSWRLHIHGGIIFCFIKIHNWTETEIPSRTSPPLPNDILYPTSPSRLYIPFPISPPLLYHLYLDYPTSPTSYRFPYPISHNSPHLPCLTPLVNFLSHTSPHLPCLTSPTVTR